MKSDLVSKGSNGNYFCDFSVLMLGKWSFIYIRGKTEWLDVAYGTSSISFRDNLIINHDGFSSQEIYNLFRKKHQVTKKVRP